MDEHDKRAREVDAGTVLAEVCRALGVRLTTAEQDRAAHAALLTALRSTAAAAVAAERARLEPLTVCCDTNGTLGMHDEGCPVLDHIRAAVAAERERCRAIADDAFTMAMGHASSGDPCQWLDTVREEIASGRSVRNLREQPDLASPAQAERVSEEHGRCPSCGSLREHAMTWCHACWFATENAGPCCCGMTNAEWRQAPNANPAALERSRIAARLRASADRREEAASRCSSTEFSQREASTHRSVAHALRAEADALEGT